MATNTPTVSSITFGGSVSETPTVTEMESSSTVTSTFTVDYTEVYALGANDPLAPTSLQLNGETNPHLLVFTPSTYTPGFSAVYNDPDALDIADKFQIQVSTDATFAGVTHWDSGLVGTSMSNVTEGSRSSELTYAGSALSAGPTFYWRIRFWDDEGNVGLWSTESASFTLEEIITENRLLGSVRLLGAARLL